MRQNKLRNALDDDKFTIGTHAMTTSPDVVEIIGLTGLVDYIEFIAEYGPYSLSELDHFSRTLELHEMSGMIKVDRENRAFVAQRAIGSGFQSILFSDVHDAAEVEECIASVRAESPLTKGSFGSADRRFAKYGMESGSSEYVQSLEDCVIALMIEKDEAVKNLDSILSVPGIDMVVFGGNDYAMSVGKPRGLSDTEMSEIGDHIYQTALNKGIQPRVETGLEHAEKYLEMGVKHFSIGTDLWMIYEWLQDRVGKLRNVIEGDKRG